MKLSYDGAKISWQLVSLLFIDPLESSVQDYFALNTLLMTHVFELNLVCYACCFGEATVSRCVTN